jgi:hypothetical protein
MAAFLGLLILSACGKTGADPVPVEAETICFAEPMQTRAVVSADIRAEFEVRDWYDNKRYYINNTLDYSGGVWVYGHGARYINNDPNTPLDDYPYEWNASRHLFFGWLGSDGKGGTNGDFFGTGYPSLSDTTLTIPAKTLDNQTLQYDFLYSDAVLRQSTETSPVQLTFKHLFAKVSISFRMSDECTSEEAIRLNRVFLAGENDAVSGNATRVAFKNSRSATVTFSGKKGSEITFADGGTAGAVGYFTKAPNGSDPATFNITGFNKASTPIDVMSQTQSFTKIPYMVWPVKKGDLDNKQVIIVEFAMRSGESYGSMTTKRMSFPKGTVWEAGHMYDYVITFKGGTLKIEETILPWEGPEPEEVGGDKAEDHQPVMASWMGWDSQTCTVSGADRTVATFKDTRDTGDVDKDTNVNELTPIRGRFRVYSPKECTWKIELTGAGASNFGLSYYYTTGTSSSVSGGESATSNQPVYSVNGAITGRISEIPGTGETAPGDLISFFISAPGGQGEAEVTAGLKFSVIEVGASARTYSLDSEIQKDGDFEIILPQAS